ncbi:MAG TPA: DUF3472 domain-containing protein [Bacteroidales bacterium]|nr:DUF3472 domain-containing protein [Bacteroidales bacterium]
MIKTIKSGKFHYWPQLFFVVAVFSSMIACACSKEGTEERKKPGSHQIDDGIFIPTAGNTWIVNQYKKSSHLITDDGVRNWGDARDTIRTFFHTTQTGFLDIGLRIKSSSGASKLKIELQDKHQEIEIEESDEFQNVYVGNFNVESIGYQEINLCGISSNGKDFGEISHVIIAGEAAPASVKFVKDDFYWGRRGPSVHLGYEIPEEAGDVEYFYNEITVPRGNDVIGSYFMANGFSHGYFGIQVNSETERRVLFSVWSPYSTDNPDDIPEDKRIVLLEKGEGVNVGEFGNEGSGGQSYKKFMWETGKTYGFLLKGVPYGSESTVYKAWFFDPDAGEWALIASFKRPETNTHLKGLYSFLENFITDAGVLKRKGHYSNQWVINGSGEWYEITKATFTADATARKEARLDYGGGVENGKFYLKNCGFFDGNTTIGTALSRVETGEHPEINFDQLPSENN